MILSMESRGTSPFEGGGQVGADLALVDWGATSLGGPETWPESLRSAVRIVLTSRFSMWMAWGPDLTFFCNDAYRRDTLGEKYPWALGRPASEVWAEIWPDIGPRIGHVMTSGEATWDEGLLLFLERNGYTEESYHTFSYSPLRGDDGAVRGMLCVVSEDTQRVISTRRIATLSGLGAALSSESSEQDVIGAACKALEEDPWSLPFVLIYGFRPDGSAELRCSAGIEPDSPAADPATWPVSQLVDGLTVLVDDLPAGLPSGGWDTPPKQVLAVPLRQQLDVEPLGCLVAGLNPHRAFDEAYEGFVSLVAGQVAAAVASARAYDEQRNRADTLAELDRAKTAFFTNISHELRTPLTLLLGPAEDALIDDTASLNPVQRGRMEVISRNAQRLLRLVNTLLDFSRLEAGNAVGRFAPVDLSSYTAELAHSFDVALDRVGLTLTVDCPPLDEPVWVDEEMWAKVVLNLMSNALKFTFEGGITVALGQDGPDVVLRVSDTGTGIPRGQQASLFERFQRVEGAQSRSHEGSGIGLALVAELAQLHGGAAFVESALGRGSTFSVRIPRGHDHLPAEQVVEQDTASVDVQRRAVGYLAEADRWLGNRTGETPSVTGDRPRVLVVDDNADMRDYVAAVLAEQYDVTTAADGGAGLDAAVTDPPDLIVSDVMMPVLDGFQLLARLRADERTTHVPVIMLSARAGEEATVDGLDAGADDYLVKPFAARELLARVRSNLELDRVRRTRAQTERSRELLDQAQRLAGISSWEFDLVTGSMRASDEFLRQMGVTLDELQGTDLSELTMRLVHPDDQQAVQDAIGAALAGDGRIDYRVRVGDRVFRSIGEVVRDGDGAPVLLRGSNQDITQQLLAETAVAETAAAREAAAREHSIADELQSSLLPQRTFDPDHLDVATYYKAGVAGTQVGGDWYDVIELGAGRTALVMGDVMGRGVRAAAVMGQLRSATRAYAQLDLPPADVLENLDIAVRELGEDQIVTCVYAVYDPSDRTLTYANAGHLPPLLCEPGRPTRPLVASSYPPLGVGLPAMREETVQLPPDSLIALYTDGLVEHRDRDLDAGIDALRAELDIRSGPLAEQPARLVEALLPDGPDDDVAVLLARIDQRSSEETSVLLPVPADLATIVDVRAQVAHVLRSWGAASTVIDDVVLIVSELVTNALLHGRPPVLLRLRNSPVHLVLEVQDGATYLPRRMRPTPDDEHGRGLQLASLLTRRWGTRPTRDGKVVWCVFAPLP
ncbi:MAG: histidine kinase [Frankiales bacterium]|nr:histidine kinase [Frankiales bacterium]